MQASQAGSTLELVVNEQQLQNMSQVDLSRQANNLGQNQTETETGGSFSFKALKSWPGRFRDNLEAKLDEAKAKSDSRWQYFKELMKAFSGLIMWLACCVVTIIIPVVLLFVGLLNLDNCTASPSLPYYVFAIGFVLTASNLFNLALAFDLPILANHRLLASDIKSIIASIVNILSYCIVAFIYTLTAYKVFTLDLQQTPNEVAVGNEPPTSLASCSHALHSVAFWFITLTLGLFLTFSTLGLLFSLYKRYRLAIIRGSAPRSHSQQTNSSGQPTSHHTIPDLATTDRL